MDQSSSVNGCAPPHQPGVLVGKRLWPVQTRITSYNVCYTKLLRACTGVHGANRLASTSLLEGLLWGLEAGQDIAKGLSRKTFVKPKLQASIPDWENPAATHEEDPALLAQDWAAIRSTMWNYVGISSYNFV